MSNPSQSVLERHNSAGLLFLVSKCILLLFLLTQDIYSANTYAYNEFIKKLNTWCLGLPTMEGKTALGASSPANPALHIPEPLSTTNAATSSVSPILFVVYKVLCVLYFTCSCSRAGYICEEYSRFCSLYIISCDEKWWLYLVRRHILPYMVMLHEPWENADLIFSLFKYWDAEFDFEYPVYKVPYD